MGCERVRACAVRVRERELRASTSRAQQDSAEEREQGCRRRAGSRRSRCRARFGSGKQAWRHSRASPSLHSLGLYEWDPASSLAPVCTPLAQPTFSSDPR